MQIFTNNNQELLAKTISEYTNLKIKNVLKVGDFFIMPDGEVRCNFEDTGKEIEWILKSKGLIK